MSRSEEEREEVIEGALEVVAITVRVAERCLTDIIENPEIIELGAKLIRKTVDALIDEGFSHEEAIGIATNVMGKFGGKGK